MGGGISRQKKTRNPPTVSNGTENVLPSQTISEPVTAIVEAVVQDNSPAIEEIMDNSTSLQIESSSANPSARVNDSLSHPFIINFASEMVTSSIQEGSLRSTQRTSPLVPRLEPLPLSLQPTYYEIVTPKSGKSSGPLPPIHDDYRVNYEANVPYTPTGEEAEIYRYYCPLCMLYFRSILKSKCCGNYICLLCTKDYLQTKHIYERDENLPPSFIEDIKNNILMNEISCPHCFTHGFHIIQVTPSEKVRDYSMRAPSGAASFYEPQASPVRVGESFEDLKRKIIPYKVLSQNTSSSAFPGNNASSPSLRLSLPLEEVNRLTSRSRESGDDHDRSVSARIAGIAMLMGGREGNESPLLSPQSTYRSKENSPTNYTQPLNDLEYSSTDALSPTNLFARTVPINVDNDEEEEAKTISSSRREIPIITSARRSSRDLSSQRVSPCIDEVSESLEAIDDSLAGMRILARNENFERDFATNMVQGVFHRAFTHQRIPPIQ